MLNETVIYSTQTLLNTLVVKQILFMAILSFLQPLMDRVIRLNDTCGVNNLHGMPGLLAAIVGIVATAFAKDDVYGNRYCLTIYHLTNTFLIKIYVHKSELQC